MESRQRLSVLLVEDNVGDARLIQELLRDNPTVRVVWVETLTSTLAHLAQSKTDLVLLDLGLPDSQGVDTVARLVRERPALPIIVLTGHKDDGLAVAALTAGAEDYLVKGAIQPDMLVRSIRYAYERKRTEVALRESHELINQIVLNVQEGIVVYNHELRYQFWNPCMEALSGVSATHVVGRHVLEVSPLLGEADVVATLQRALGGEAVTIPEIPYRVPESGRESWITASFGPLRNAQGAIIGVIGNLRDITLYKEAEEALRSLSTMDELTGLHNRRGFLALAQQYLEVADRNRQALLLLFADLDGLKAINDTLGHRAGDQVLRDVATVLKQTFRASDVIARLGGDEFGILAMETPLTSAVEVLARLHRSLDAHNADATLPLSLSLGVVCYDWEHRCSLEELLARADAAMYQQKREKKKP